MRRVDRWLGVQHAGHHDQPGVGQLIAIELFDLPGRIGPAVWWLGIGAGTLVVAAVGWLATRRLLAVPPMQVLNSG